jgi:hypothetical protein
MLMSKAEAVMLDLDGSGAPKMPADGHVWIYRPGRTSHRGRFKPGTSLLGLFGDGRQGYSAPESTPGGALSGECRINGMKFIYSAEVQEHRLKNWREGDRS